MRRINIYCFYSWEGTIVFKSNEMLDLKVGCIENWKRKVWNVGREIWLGIEGGRSVSEKHIRSKEKGGGEARGNKRGRCMV